MGLYETPTKGFTMEAKTAEKIMFASSVAIIAAIPTIAFIRGFKEKASEIAQNPKNNPIKVIATIANSISA